MLSRNNKKIKKTVKKTPKILKNKKVKEESKSKTKVSLKSCSPSVGSKNSKNNTCFDFEALLTIARSWNKSNPKDLIKIPSNKNSYKLWIEIDKRLKNKCDSEWCWIEQEFLKKLGSKEFKGIFRPKMPKSWKANKYEWLSTVDIESVMKQYEDKYKDFKFIGPVPIDFDYEYTVGQCIVNELCKLNLKKLMDNKITKVGVIFNLDPHDKSGSHWNALYLDLGIKKVYFFDSYASEPTKEVKALIERIQTQGKELGLDIEYKYNQTRQQYKNSECGVYSIYFITQLLEGKKTFSDIEKASLPDDYINTKRNDFYIAD